MKKINLFTVLAVVAIIFSSCSNNETELPEEQSLELLKSYTIKRDASGAYSLDYSLNGNVNSENVVDEITNTNNIYLYWTDQQLSRKVTKDLTIDGTELTVGFVDTKSNISHNITINDDNFFLAKNTDTSNSKLNDYSIASNLDGTYTLEFSVKKKVRVDFVFNEEIDTYEIHLEDGKTGELNFSRVLEKEEGKPLKFDFVNHIENTQARSNSSTEIRKPQGIIL